MASPLELKMLSHQYETTIAEYITKEGGHVIALSDDQSFLSLLRTMASKHLAIEGMVSTLQDPALLAQTMQEKLKYHSCLVILMEKLVNGRDLSHIIREVKDEHPEGVRLILLTTSLVKDQVILLHEIGADNFVTKPISANTLIEKLAFTLKPQNKLGQLIDAAKLQLAQGNLAETFESVRRILEIKPNSAAALMIQGDAYHTLGDLPRAKACYKQANEFADTYLDPLLRLSSLCAETGDTLEQLGYLEQLDALSPLNVDRKLAIGALYLSHGQTERAEEFFTSAVTLAAKDTLHDYVDVTNRIVTIYSAQGNSAMAELYQQQCQASSSAQSATRCVAPNLLTGEK